MNVRKSRLIVWGSLLSALGALAWSSDARACGGCFAPPVQGNDSGTIVTSHRMALSISPDQTILWDQIQYTGSPAEFAWVLPVKPGARIDVASEAWFDVLDAATGTSVSPPLLECKTPGFFGCSVVPGAGTGFGCGSSEDAGPEGTEPDPVEIVSHGATGPYESVIIHSDVPGALTQWLDDHGYAIPGDIAPIIEAYQSEGFDFAALRLLPSSGIQQMRPVRVVQSGAVPVLPLRMVAAGTGARTAITLFVIGEGRYTTDNIPEIPIPRWLVNWDFNTATSNYAQVRDVTYGGGEVFFTAYSLPGALLGPIPNPQNGYPTTYLTTAGWAFNTVAEAFVEQAFVNGETSSTDCVEAFADLADEERRVVLPCGDDLDPECFVNPETEIDARTLQCAPPLGSDIPLDDLGQALVGMHPADVWITRLEANLTRDALGKDLTVKASSNQDPVWGTFEAASATNLPPRCRFPPGAAAAPGGSDTDSGVRLERFAPAFFSFGLGLLLLLRRLAARRGRRAVPAGQAWEAAR
jgi:hypothetical protein